MLPVLLRRWQRRPFDAHLGRWLLVIRRLAILVILLLGYLYYRLAGEAYALVAIGLISFAAVAQFAPVVFAALYWRGGTREGALAGLTAGFVVWIYTLLLPSFARSGWLPPMFMDSGIFGVDLFETPGPVWSHRLERRHPQPVLEPNRQYRRLPDGLRPALPQRGGGRPGRPLC